MQVPPALAEAAIVGPTSELVRRVEIWEADGLTRWQNGAQDNRLIGGSVTIDYSRDERRSFDLELDNTDFGLEHTPSAFWYDKIIKTYCGVRYTSIAGVETQQVRTNYFINPRFEAALGAAYAARKNLHPNPLFVDGNADGRADGGSAYVTGGATGTPTCPTGKQQFASVNIAAGTSRYGMQWDITVASSATQERTLSVDYTLSGAPVNKRVQLYCDPFDSTPAIVPGTTRNATGIDTAGRLKITIPASAAIVLLRVYMWVDTTDAAAASGITATFSRPLFEESSIELPYFDINEKPRERVNLHVNSLCTFGGTQNWYSNNGTFYVPSINTTRGTPFGTNSIAWTKGGGSGSAALSGYSHDGVSLTNWKCNPGDSVTVSVWMSTDAINREGYVYVQWKDAAGGLLAIDNIVNPRYDIQQGGWTEVWATDVAPANAVAFYPVYIMQDKTLAVVPDGEVNFTTAMSVEKTPYHRDFFHPSLLPPTGFSAAWAGTANQSSVYLIQTDPTVAWAGTANASITEFRFQPAGSMTGLYDSGGRACSLRATSGNGSLNTYSSRIWCYGTNKGSGALTQYQTAGMPTAVEGEVWSMRVRARVVMSKDRDITFSPRLAAYSVGAFLANVTTSSSSTLPKSGAWVDIICPNTAANPATTANMRFLSYMGSTGLQEGEAIEIEAILFEKSATPGGYFDGGIVDFGNRDFAWVSTPNASASTETRTIIDQTPVQTTWEVQVGEFMIDSISEDHFPYTVKVTGRDYTKKCLVSKFTTATSYASGSSIESTIKTIAQNAGITKFIFPVTGHSLGKNYVFERGTTRWEAMKSIAEGFGYELFFDAQGYLVLREFLDPVTAPLAYTLGTGTFGNLVSYNKTVNDTRIYNHIVVTGESTDSTVLPVSAEATNTEPSSPTRIAKLGDRVYQYTSSFITTVTQAQDVADKFLQLHSLEEFDLNFSSIALPWLEVGEIVEFDDPRPSAGQPTRFLLSSLTLPLDLGPMSGNAKRVSVVG